MPRPFILPCILPRPHGTRHRCPGGPAQGAAGRPANASHATGMARSGQDICTKERMKACAKTCARPASNATQFEAGARRNSSQFVREVTRHLPRKSHARRHVGSRPHGGFPPPSGRANPITEDTSIGPKYRLSNDPGCVSLSKKTSPASSARHPLHTGIARPSLSACSTTATGVPSMRTCPSRTQTCCGETAPIRLSSGMCAGR